MITDAGVMLVTKLTQKWQKYQLHLITFERKTKKGDLVKLQQEAVLLSSTHSPQIYIDNQQLNFLLNYICS